MQDRISSHEELSSEHTRIHDVEKLDPSHGDRPGAIECQQQENQSLDANSPITHIYLAFDTVLPQPPTGSYESASHDGSKIPPQPDLRAFTSPLTWTNSRKRFLLLLSCLATFVTAYSAGSYSPPTPLMAADLGTTQLVALVGITTFCIGFALAPMVLAPVSEVWGRYPVFVAAGIVYIVFEAVCAVVTNVAGMLVARFFVGGGASVFSSVVGGVLADMWEKEDRNTAMSIFSGCVLAGTGAGPLVTSALIYRLNDPTTAWQWGFWHQVITGGLTVLAIVIFFRETRASVLLSRKAKKLNHWYEKLENAGLYGLWVVESENGVIALGSCPSNREKETPVLRRVRWKVKADEERASLRTMMATSIMRPFYLLVTEPIVFWFSLWAAFAWGVLYLAFAVVPYLHGDDFKGSARTYAAIIAGAVVATLAGISQDKLLQHPQWRQDAAARHSASPFWALLRRWLPAESPEARLYFTCITAIFLPAGIFGSFMSSGTSASVDDSDGGTSLAVGFGFATWGIYSIYLASFNYLADSYHIYASSVLAANSFCRNVLGGSFPLLTAIMFNNLGIRGAGGMLAALALALTVIPFILVFWGPAIRARSKTAILLQK